MGFQSMRQREPMIPLRRVLGIIRLLAVVELVLSALLVPVGLAGAALGTGFELSAHGVVGAFLGGALAVVTTRVLSTPGEMSWSRHVVATGIAVAGAAVLLGVVIGGGLSGNLAVIAASVAGFLVVLGSSRSLGQTVVIGTLAAATLAFGAVVFWDGTAQEEFDARRAARAALVPDDLFDVRGPVEAATPDGWHAAALKARVTDRAPLLVSLRLLLSGRSNVRSDSRTLPDRLVDQPLRGIIVVDCAGSEQLEVVARGGDSRGVLGTSPCRPDPQVVAIEIPGAVLRREQQYVWADYVYVDPVEEGPTGGMNRALLLVALAGTPDPDGEALLATFVAAFGTERPR
jgi:hypothetical protein